MRMISCILFFLAVLSAGPAIAATTVTDAKRELSFALPAGFVENPGGTRSPMLNLSFVRGEPGKPGFAVLRVVSMGETLDRGKLHRAVVERSAREAMRGRGVESIRFEYKQARWKSFELEVLVTHGKREGHGILSLSTQVPLAKEGIQLFLVGLAEDQAKLIADLQSVLSSLQGKSSWR